MQKSLLRFGLKPCGPCAPPFGACARWSCSAVRPHAQAFVLPGGPEDRYRLAKLSSGVTEARDKVGLSDVLASEDDGDQGLPRLERSANKYPLFSLRAFLLKVLKNTKLLTAQHVRKGRLPASSYRLGFQDLCDKLMLQEGRCAYSGLVLTLRPFSHWHCSLGRRNPDDGYSFDNCVFVAKEFQTAMEWSRRKVQMLPIRQRQGMHLVDAWPTRGNDVMIESAHGELKLNIKKLRQGAKNHAKQRARAGRADAGVCTLTTQELMDMYVRQRGVCALSGTPLDVSDESEWPMSVERFNNNQGYVASNCGLIYRGFQSTDHTLAAPSPDVIIGSPQWSIDKCRHVIDWIEDEHVQRWLGA